MIFGAALFSAAALVNISTASDLSNSFKYISPLPGAKLVSKATNIILKPGGILDTNHSQWPFNVRIEGSLSGIHSYQALLSDDRETIVLKPLEIFMPGEIITIYLNDGIRTIDGHITGTGSFSFTISPQTERVEIGPAYFDEITAFNDQDSNEDITTGTYYDYETNDDPSLPTDFPGRIITVSNEPDSGYVFLSARYLMILDNEAYPVYFRKAIDLAYDFKVQPNGLITYFERAVNRFYAMDSTYTVVDSFQCGNGYADLTDFHDFQILDNDHALLLAKDPQLIDMSVIIEGGNPNALVHGQIIQELDTSKNVVWEWRSWDHFEITDATWDINLRDPIIDYVHANAVELDNDGNLLLSCRNMDEITKINFETGDIIWRLGGENNEFDLVDDNRWFSHQHDIRRLPGGNVTLYDNGNLNSPQYSRALEYQLDEVLKTATRIWEFRDNPDKFSFIMGNHQRLPGGNSVIGWGGGTPTFTEVSPDGEKAFEVVSGPSYRSFRFPWRGVAAKPYLLTEINDSSVHMIFNKFGDTTVAGYYIYLDDSPDPDSIIDSTSNNYYDITLSSGDYYARVSAYNNQHVESRLSKEILISIDADYKFYLPGDANMYNGAWPPSVIGGDVTYLVNYFRSIPTSPACLLEGFYSAADINGDCSVIGGDVTRLVNYFRGQAEIVYCPDYEPAWPTPDDLPTEAPMGWPNCDE